MYLFAGRRNFIRSLAFATGFLVSEHKVLNAQDKHSEADSEDASDDNPVYEPGGDVKAPKLIHYVEPEFSPSSKEAFVEGIVKIATVVTVGGKPTGSRVVSGLNAEEDRTAVEALKQWRFQPGTKGGQPVKVRVIVEINFHLL